MIQFREMFAALGRDSATRAQIIQAVGWLAPVFWIGIWLVARVLRDRGHLDPQQYQWMLRLGIVAAVALGMLAARLFRIFAEGLVGAAFASGSAPRQPGFSLEESLIARGQFSQARDTLEARLDGGADDLAIHLRLAELHARWLKDPAAAERSFLAARKLAGDDRQQATVANGLIDLYRASGQTGRLMVELARFATAYPATRAGQDARRELQDLKGRVA